MSSHQQTNFPLGNISGEIIPNVCSSSCIPRQPDVQCSKGFSRNVYVITSTYKFRLGNISGECISQHVLIFKVSSMQIVTTMISFKCR